MRENVSREVRGVGRNCNTKPLLDNASFQAKKREFRLVRRQTWKEFNKKIRRLRRNLAAV